MKLLSRQGFTLIELIITVAVIAIVSSIGLRNTYTFLQEQKLRQASNELLSYLLTARAKALREANVSELGKAKACEVKIESSDTIPPTISPSPDSEVPGVAANICNDSPSLPELNLLAASGGSNLTLTASDGGSSPFFITFTRMGTVASSNLSSSESVTLPRTFYLSNPSATNLQRCVMVDLNSLRIGWRNSADEACTYNGH
jgi:prepilin-type N-terminal cleavage/methylation domain-containing protein